MESGHNSNRILSYRKRFQGIIENLQNNIDTADRQFVETGDKGRLWQYYRLIEEMKKIKNQILEKEKEMKNDYQQF